MANYRLALIAVFVVTLAGVLPAQTATYSLGATGCGNNSISCWNDPASNSSALSFTAEGVSNGKPVGNASQWLFDGRMGTFTSFSIPDYPIPTPNYQFFPFHLLMSGGGISVILDMRGFRGRYGVTAYSTTGGTLTVE